MRTIRTINIATSFSGIGAPECALNKLKLKHNILFAGDIDEFCKKSYFANYNIDESKWHSDIRKFNATPFLGKVDIYIGGSPCQSFSVMGKRKGLEEARGTLFYEYARLVAESQPNVFIYENVTGMLNHDGGKTWEIISNIFDSLGYNWKYWILNAKDYGIPQNRRRIYVVGFKKELKSYFDKLHEPQKQDLKYYMSHFLQKEVPNKYYLPIKGFNRVIDPNQKKHVALNSSISRCQVACQQYNWFGDMRFETEIPERIEKDERIHKGYFNGEFGITRILTPRECLRLMGFPDSFKIEVNDTQMYRQSGNSMAVNVVEKVLESIINTGIFDKDE